MEILQNSNQKNPHLAFIGLGWIVRNRMEAIVKNRIRIHCLPSDINKLLINNKFGPPAEQAARSALLIDNIYRR